jgi:hypothetical protein
MHLAGLYAVLELELPPRQATNVLRRVLRHRDDFPVLTRTHGPGELTILHLVGASDAGAYEQRARAWATAVWSAWSQHHALIADAVAAAEV